jgi:hypothetical protein
MPSAFMPGTTEATAKTTSAFALFSNEWLSSAVATMFVFPTLNNNPNGVGQKVYTQHANTGGRTI